MGVPAVVIAYTWIRSAVLEFYEAHTEQTLQPANFWLASGPEIIASVIIGLFVAFWGFRSERVGMAVVITGTTTFLLLVLYIWSVLNG